MKIVIIQGAFLPVPPLMGGAVEKIWFCLGKEFAKAEHDILHLSRSHPELSSAETISGVRHQRIRGFNTPRSGLHLKLCDLLYSRRVCRLVPNDADVVITNTFWSPILIPKHLRNRVLVDVQRMPKGQMRWYKQARLRANSTPVAAAIRRELPTSEHHRVTMIPNPLPITVDSPLDDSAKPPGLLYCGRVHPEKGLSLLIQAVRLLAKPWPVRIVGPWQTTQGGGGEDYLAELKALARGLPIEFVGPVHDPAALNTEYRNAPIFIYPSVAEAGETFGSAPLEAMAWGAVPIISNLDCFKDFTQSGRNGLIFDHRSPDSANQLAAAIEKLMADSAQRQRMATQALQVRSTHAPTTIAQMFLEDFSQHLGQTR